MSRVPAPRGCRLRVPELHTLRHEVDAPHVVAVGVVLDGGHGGLQLLVAHGHLLDGVPAAALLHLHDLAVAGELVGDLPHPRHADIGELYGEVAVLVRDYIVRRCGSQ